MTRAFRVVVLIAGLAFTAAPAVASPITWLLQGTVFVSDLSGINVGDAASMSLTFESTTPDLESNPGCGLYLGAITSVTAVLGSQTYQFVSHGPVGNGIEVSTGAGTVVACGITPGTFPAYTYRAFGVDGQLLAFWEQGPVLSDALPLVPPSVALFDAAFGIYTSPLGRPGALARTSSAQVVPVPEPASVFFFGTGVVTAVVLRRHRRR